MGILGRVIAGAVRGGADEQIKTNRAQEAFDMKRALQEADAELNMRLKEAGIKMQQEAKAADRKEVSGIINSVEDPNADAGGYETPEMKTKAERDLVTRKRDALVNAGRLDEAKTFDDQIKQMDARDNKEAVLAQKMAALEVKQERYAQQAETAQAKLELAAAKVDVAAAKSKAGKSLTKAEMKENAFHRAYGDNPEYIKGGKLTPKGYRELYGDSEADLIDETTTVTEEPVDPDDFSAGTKKITKKVKSRKGDPKVLKYDPKTRTFK